MYILSCSYIDRSLITFTCSNISQIEPKKQSKANINDVFLLKVYLSIPQKKYYEGYHSENNKKHYLSLNKILEYDEHI